MIASLFISSSSARALITPETSILLSDFPHNLPPQYPPLSCSGGAPPDMPLSYFRAVTRCVTLRHAALSLSLSVRQCWFSPPSKSLMHKALPSKTACQDDQNAGSSSSLREKEQSKEILGINITLCRKARKMLHKHAIKRTILPLTSTTRGLTESYTAVATIKGER